MKFQSSWWVFGLLPLVAVASASLGFRAGTTAPSTFQACMDGKNRVLASSIRRGTAPACPRGTTLVSWNVEGARGPAGPVGPTGPAGAMGVPGPRGPTGSGARAWTDATGTPFGYPVGQGRVVLAVEGRRLGASVHWSLSEGPWTAHAVWKQYEMGLAPRMFENAQCTGEPLFRVSGPLNMFGLDAPAVMDYPDAESAHLIELDPDSARLRQIACMTNSSGEPIPGNYGAYYTARAAAVHDLNVLFPPPLSLQ